MSLRWVVVATLALTVLGACSSRTTATPSPAATAEPTTNPAALATPEPGGPAAGTCLGPDEGSTGTITINEDVPSPRCLQIRPSQRLILVNATAHSMTARVGRLEMRLEKGGTVQTTLGVGRYLVAGGVHRVRLSRAPFSAELLVLRR